MLKAGLPPVASEDARLLILGSLPGDASLAAREYYAHPRNHFWPLLSGIIGRDLVAMDYPERIGALRQARVALWDVVAEAERPGSLDQKIRHAQMNNLPDFLTGLPALEAVAFNGRKSAALAADAIGDLRVDVVRLPSSSPANTLNIEAKRAIWAVLKRYLSMR
ncbi:MAG: DNA-deoxyinosine glycosylase [Sphingomonadaceae bacterium]|nr:DNA-deoxyinosine glycosylase [Sphingomonadaceae bacterium]